MIVEDPPVADLGDVVADDVVEAAERDDRHERDQRG